MLSMMHVTRGHLRSYLTSFYQNFAPPSAAHAFNYNIPFIKNIPFITISPPLQPMLSMIHVTRSHLRPYLTSFYQNFPPPPSAAHAFNYIPFIKHIPFIKIFPLPLQPMLSTTFLLWKTFLLSKFPPPSAAHAFNYIPFIKNIPFPTFHTKKQVGSPVSPNIGSQSTSRRHWKYCAGHTKSLSITCDPSQQACIGSGEIISEASNLLHLPHKSHLTLPNQHV